MCIHIHAHMPKRGCLKTGNNMKQNNQMTPSCNEHPLYKRVSFMCTSSREHEINNLSKNETLLPPKLSSAQAFSLTR